ncbi:hypothetical protein [Mesorhizobium ciceri]|uniref:hypothetical protein n=1 Tax=Mesorhizobium TaxID=68287 RepID=UPI00047EAC58|nr:hypothetical protein [Mesorhizobium ciceri]
MPRFRLLTSFMSGMLATVTLPGPVASAPVLNPANRNALVQQNELLMLENRLRRQQYQEQQQQFRAKDREQQRPGRPLICQVQRSGNGFVSICR